LVETEWKTHTVSSSRSEYTDGVLRCNMLHNLTFGLYQHYGDSFEIGRSEFQYNERQNT